MERHSAVISETQYYIEMEMDEASLAKKATQIILEKALLSIQEKGFFSLVLSGGKTPTATYKCLALSSLPWPKIHLFWGDERNVSPQSFDSNFKMANDLLISKISIPAENIHRIQGELADTKEAAQIYERDLRLFFETHQKGSPHFDIILLGLGEDGHTASLFPGSDSTLITDAWVSSFWVEKLKSFRITMRPKILNQASIIIVLVSGSNKSKIVKKVLGEKNESNDSTKYPILSILPQDGKLIWLLDKVSASELINT
jgi:6-phosphogluconolactonase